MKFVGLVVCGAGALGSVLLSPAVAHAEAVQCVSTSGQQMTVVEPAAACGSAVEDRGTAAAYGLGGIGYAKSIGGASALGVGVSGGVGASEGTGGVPAALGLGPGSVAIVSVERGSLSLAIAGTGSNALVADVDQGVVCAGSAAMAWNALSGVACVATPVGVFSTR